MNEEKQSTITNAMSVDVEDYFQVSALEPYVRRDDWEKIPSRIERNIERILALFENKGARGTFFVLGWVAERFPEIVRRIADAGHEVASHGYEHIRVSQQTREQFGEDASRTKRLLEDVSGCEVKGYRAASFSIGRSNLWALDCLLEVGYRYSSSIYPIRHDLYGMPEAPRFGFVHSPGGILEIPISTVPVMSQNLPCGGGGYFRLFPYWLSSWAVRRINRRDAEPAVFYFHPWEIDALQPRQKGIDLKTRFRHYLNLGIMEQKLGRLLEDFRWERMDEVFLGQGQDRYPVRDAPRERTG